MKKVLVAMLLCFVLVQLPTTVNAEESVKGNSNAKTEVQVEVEEYIETVEENEQQKSDFKEKIRYKTPEELETIIHKFENSGELTERDQELKELAEEELQSDLEDEQAIYIFGWFLGICLVLALIFGILNSYEESSSTSVW